MPISLKQLCNLCVFSLLPAPVTSIPVQIRDLAGSSPCTATSPINGDCNVDWEMDQAQGVSDMRDPAQRKRLYAPTYHAVFSDNMPVVVTSGKKTRGKRQDSSTPTGLFEELARWFKNASSTIAVEANKAHKAKAVTDLLQYGFSETGPSPPEGLAPCSPADDFSVWCNATTNEVFTDTVTHQNLLDGMEDVQDSDDPGPVCVTKNGDIPCPDATFWNITALNSTVTWHHFGNGNIYVLNSEMFQEHAPDVLQARLFSGKAPFVTGGSVGRVLHGYNDTMRQYNVSRLRLSHAEAMPNQSLPVSLVPAANGVGGPAVLVAADTSSYVYYIITCSFVETYAKVFLARSLAQGIQMLMEPTMKSTIIGGTVKQCYAVPYSNGAGPI